MVDFSFVPSSYLSALVHTLYVFGYIESTQVEVRTTLGVIFGNADRSFCSNQTFKQIEIHSHGGQAN